MGRERRVKRQRRLHRPRTQIDAATVEGTAVLHLDESILDATDIAHLAYQES